MWAFCIKLHTGSTLSYSYYTYMYVCALLSKCMFAANSHAAVTTCGFPSCIHNDCVCTSCLWIIFFRSHYFVLHVHICMYVCIYRLVWYPLSTLQALWLSLAGTFFSLCLQFVGITFVAAAEQLEWEVLLHIQEICIKSSERQANFNPIQFVVIHKILYIIHMSAYIIHNQQLPLAHTHTFTHSLQI